MEKTNENREEEILEEEGEFKIEDEHTAEGEEGEEKEEEGEEGEEGKSDDEDDYLKKFEGKSKEEVVESYKNLEKLIEKKALEKAQKLIQGKSSILKDGKPATKEELDEFEEELKAIDFSKMPPKEFARWLNKRVMIQATRIAQNIYDQTSEMKSSVTREMKEAYKLHPHLKENAEYREIVISLIEAAASRKEVVTLKEACKKADKAMGIKPSEKKDENKEEKEVEGEKKKPKFAVEKPEGGDGKSPDSEEEKIKKGMLSAGGNTFLGGL